MRSVCLSAGLEAKYTDAGLYSEHQIPEIVDKGAAVVGRETDTPAR